MRHTPTFPPSNLQPSPPLDRPSRAWYPPPTPGERLHAEEATRRVEEYLIRRALERCDGVQSRAAEFLGTTRRILKYKIDQFNIPAHDRS